MTLLTTRTDAAALRPQLADAFRTVRMMSRKLTQPLSSEDMVVQVEPCASPTKWHLAHTTWFFENFVLQQYEKDFAWHDEQFPFLYNSYYHTVGKMHARPKRGLITRPTLEEVFVFRNNIDDRIMTLIEHCDDDTLIEIAPLIELGLNHEQQHQELLLTDIKLLFVANPLGPAYQTNQRSRQPATADTESVTFVQFDEGIVEIGHDGEHFAYDNEGPRHRRFLEPFEIADRLVTNGEYLEFIEDGGYEDSRHWLDDGWTRIRTERWTHPLYWRRDDNDTWREFTLAGWRPLDMNSPACHISFFEADAFARWRGDRLPTEAEWEHASEQAKIEGNFLERNALHPLPSPSGRGAGGEGSSSPSELKQIFGDVWEWTRSNHEPYPGYQPPEGSIGEYNGKFMNNTYVCRGGSCVTSMSHIRRTYRNFFEPGARWQFTGIRLARSTS